MLQYSIKGEQTQHIDFQLRPQEKIMAEPGVMTMIGENCHLSTVIGSGAEDEGVFGKLFSAGQRILSGEKLAIAMIENKGMKSERVVLSAPYPGTIFEINLADHGGSFLAQKGAYLCSTPGTKISIALQKKLSVGFLGGEGFVLQRLSGDNLAFLHAGGSLITHRIEEGEKLLVDTGSVVGFSTSISYQIRFVKGVKNLLLGHEGISLVELEGPGLAYIQSLPFNRLADRVLSHLPPNIFEKGQ